GCQRRWGTVKKGKNHPLQNHVAGCNNAKSKPYRKKWLAHQVAPLLCNNKHSQAKNQRIEAHGATTNKIVDKPKAKSSQRRQHAWTIKCPEIACEQTKRRCNRAGIWYWKKRCHAQQDEQNTNGSG